MILFAQHNTDTKIDTVPFSKHEIISIIRSLNQHKTHGLVNVSSRMIQI